MLLGEGMIQEERKVGRKGQVVIPAAMRKALKIEPGSKITATLDVDKLILRKVS
jgi:AbrB family looped-hinge helix DNA binding protein